MDIQSTPTALSSSGEAITTIFSQFVQARGQFVKACQQVHLLGAKLRSLRKRFERARAGKNSLFTYTYHLQITTLESVRDMYEEYARKKSAQLLFISDVIDHTQMLRVYPGNSQTDLLDEEQDSNPEVLFSATADNSDTRMESERGIANLSEREETSLSSNGRNPYATDEERPALMMDQVSDDAPMEEEGVPVHFQDNSSLTHVNAESFSMNWDLMDYLEDCEDDSEDDFDLSDEELGEVDEEMVSLYEQTVNDTLETFSLVWTGP